MSRSSVFLSAGGDPFILNLVLKLWKKYWYDEIDRMWICYNNNSKIPLPVVKELLSSLLDEPKIRLIYHPTGIGNGRPITEMALISQEDTVMLLEDDGFIFTPGRVASYFKMIEDGYCDAIGSPRFSCGDELAWALQRKYKLDYTGYGDVGPNFWPNFFFCKRKDLLRTDIDFGSHKFSRDEEYKQLDHMFVADCMADTFVWACVQLRALKLRFHNVSQFHADPYEIDNKQKGEMNWKDGKPYWIHGGSLSTSWNGYLSGVIPDVTADISKQEIETRCALWTIANHITEGFNEFKVDYQIGITDLIHNAQLDTGRIDKKINIYHELMGI